MATIDFPPASRGGEGVMAFKAAEALAARGIELDVVAPHSEGARDFDRRQSFQVHRVPVAGETFISRIPSFFWQSAALIRRYDGDVVYSLRPVVNSKHVPTVHHFHTVRLGEAVGCWRSRSYGAALANALYIPMDAYAARTASAVVALTEDMSRLIQRFSGIAPTKIQVIPNSIDLREWPSKFPRDYDGQKILFVGRLDARKGIRSLVGSLLNLMAQRTSITFTIVGDGPLRDLLDQKIAESGMAARVSLLNAVDKENLAKIYQQHDLLVVPSTYEGFGLVIAEAMSCATPVLSSSACVDLGQPMFAVNDSHAMTNEIEELVYDPARLTAVAEQGLESITELGKKDPVKSLVDTFQKVISGQSCAG